MRNSLNTILGVGLVMLLAACTGPAGPTNASSVPPVSAPPASPTLTPTPTPAPEAPACEHFAKMGELSPAAVKELNKAGGTDWVGWAGPSTGDGVIVKALPKNDVADALWAAGDKPSDGPHDHSFACRSWSFTAESADVLPFILGLGVGDLALTLDFPADETVGNPQAMEQLGQTPGLRWLDVDAVPVDQLPPMPTLSALVIETQTSVNTPLAALGAKAPALTQLCIAINPDATWNAADWSGLRGLKYLTFSAKPTTAGTPCVNATLNGVSPQTMDLVLAAASSLPSLIWLNLKDPKDQTAQLLAPEGTASPAERERRRVVELGSQYMGNPTGAPGWTKQKSITSIPLPMVIADGSFNETSIGKSYRGIPASKLCKTVDQCAAVVVIDVKQGGFYANYRPERNPSGKTVPGYYGLTTVTVYDLNKMTISGPVVVAKTKPADKDTLPIVGPADLGKAARWIQSHS